MVEQHPTQSPSATSFEKDLEIQSRTPRSSSTQRPNHVDKEEKEEGIEFGSEAEEDGLDEQDPHSHVVGGSRAASALGAGVTRTSTKSSWKDPGPPPDGGWAWAQGELSISCHFGFYRYQFA
jgi:hypothetical protein